MIFKAAGDPEQNPRAAGSSQLNVNEEEIEEEEKEEGEEEVGWLLVLEMARSLVALSKHIRIGIGKSLDNIIYSV